jgi:putative endopeptidase
MPIDMIPDRVRRGHVSKDVLLAVLVPTLLAAGLSWWAVSAARAQAADFGKPSPLESSVDTTIKPGDDFFAYANGSWLKATAMPAGKERWGARDQINIEVHERILKVLDDARTAPPGSAARKVADYRAAYMNESVIDVRGIAPLKPALDSIDRVRDKAALTRMLGSGMRADVDPLNYGVYQSSHLLGLSVQKGIHGEKSYVAFLLQGGLGLPDRENYVSIKPEMEALRVQYRAYIEHQLALAGFDHSDQRAEAVMALETAIALSQGTREQSAVDRNGDHRWTRADFARQAPGMDWTAFFDAAGLGKQQSFVAWQPMAVTGAAALVASQPLDAWKDYLRFQLIDHYADVLPRAFAEQALTLHRAAAPDQLPDSSRAQRAIDATQLAMSDAIGRMYVEHYFPAAQKARVQAIVSNVAEAFKRRVEGATWMSSTSKKVALAKLKVLYVGVGYPEHWQDYSDLVVDPADAFGNLRRVEARSYHRALARLTIPVDDAEWLVVPQQVGAILAFQLNSYAFSAALLQPPKFDPTASDAATYGAIGAIFGHDFTHYVDVLGAEYDVDGGFRHWWTAEDSVRHQALADPLDRQFASYHPFPDASVDGKLTQRENIADLGGLASAFDAYRLSLGSKVNDKSYLRQQDREFFLGFAQTFRVRFSDAGMRKQLANDHAPEMYRVATVRNLDAWYGAFDVTPGQRLYVEPKERVRIW